MADIDSGANAATIPRMLKMIMAANIQFEIGASINLSRFIISSTTQATAAKISAKSDGVNFPMIESWVGEKVIAITPNQNKAFSRQFVILHSFLQQLVVIPLPPSSSWHIK